MNPLAWLALSPYVLGVAGFLIFYRDKVLGGWFQTLFTALLWPLLAVVVIYQAHKKDSQ